MKKISVGALLTVTFVSISCMELEKQYSQEYSQPGYNEPGWIYTTNQYPATHVPILAPHQSAQYYSYTNIPMPLVGTIQPSYAPLSHKALEGSRKVEFTLSSVEGEGRPDQKIVRKLYDNAYQLLKNTDASKLRKNYDNFNLALCNRTLLYLHTSQKLAELIYSLNQYNIDEHVMEQFAYTQQNVSQPNSVYATLLFNLLQQYRITKGNEQLPFNPDATESRLTQTFCVPFTTNNTTHISPIHITYAQQYPAFTDLLHKLSCVLAYYSVKNYHTLTSWMHSAKPITIDDYSARTYSNIKMYFYNKTCALLEQRKECISYELIYELVQIIEKATHNNEIREYDFGKNILNLKPEASLLNNILSSELPLLNRQIAALLYKQIQNYHIARGNKTTPTPKQYEAYAITQDFKFVVPAFLSNSMLNNDTYALDEFEELKSKIVILLSSTQKQINENIDQIYNC